RIDDLNVDVSRVRVAGGEKDIRPTAVELDGAERDPFGFRLLQESAPHEEGVRSDSIPAAAIVVHEFADARRGFIDVSAGIVLRARLADGECQRTGEHQGTQDLHGRLERTIAPMRMGTYPPNGPLAGISREFFRILGRFSATPV